MDVPAVVLRVTTQAFPFQRPWAPLLGPGILLPGWRGFALISLAGAAGALALPPVGWVPMMALSIAVLVWAWFGATTRTQVFRLAWAWGLGYYTVGFYWIANALLVDAARFAWMIPFATLGLGALMAVFGASAVLAAHLVSERLAPRPGPSRILWLAVFWTISEWCRTFVMTGFPWNPLGSVWNDILPVLQLGALTGIHGLSLMTMLVFGLLASAPFLSNPRRRAWGAVCPVIILAVIAAAGWVRMDAHATTYVDGPVLRLVQPAIKQADKWRPGTRDTVLDDLVELSRRPGFDTVTHVIWPESAAPFDLTDDLIRRQRAALAAPVGGLLLAGAPRAVLGTTGTWHYLNSLLALNGAGQILGIYDKVHLVPFGEYVPMRRILPLPSALNAVGEFSPGPGPQTLILPGTPPVGPQICYESIFPGKMINKSQVRPKWLLIVTNDGWFGNSAGPYQHLAAGRMRAIEEGLPVVRVANTGISGVFDSVGRMTAKLDLGTRGIVDVRLPEAMASVPPYGRFGDGVALVLVLCVSLVAVAVRHTI